ncbi:MAG: hypothetical protein E7445_02350 [Ruminococcaceae bacterium]|nr:hypothetical protein [Oscillospiraceae bacterium]
MAEKKQEMTMENLREQMQAMLAEAKAEAAALVENARAEAARIAAEAKGGVAGMTAEEAAAYEAYMNEEVEVKLFRDNDKYKDPVFVGCNGETIAIQRGEKVKIKRKFAEILDNSDKQDYETGLLIRRKSAEFAGAEE